MVKFSAECEAPYVRTISNGVFFKMVRSERFVNFISAFQRENKLLGCNVFLILITDIVPSLW